MNFLSRTFFLVLLGAFTLGCSSAPTSTPSPSVEILPPVTETLPPASLAPSLTPTFSPIPSLAPTSPPSADNGIFAAPVFVIITPDALWAIGANGTGLYKVVDDHVLAPQDTSAMPAPGGGFAAYLTGDSRLRDLTLKIVHVPRGLVYAIPLASPEYAIQEGAAQGDPEVEAARTVVERTSFAWSPDGSQLAFMGMRDGPSSDMYTFLMADFWVLTEEQALKGVQTTRWTDGPSQGISPTWSPDGRYLLHAGVHTLGTEAGSVMAGVWAVDTLTGEVIDVYTPVSGAETFVGWQDQDTFLVYSWTPECGNVNLREVDIPTRETRPVWDQPFNGVAYDPTSGGVLVTIDQFTANCVEGGQAGAVYLPGGGPAALLYTDLEAFLPVWDEIAQLFFFRTAEDVFYATPSGFADPIEAPEPSLPSVSARGDLVWASYSGVWVGKLDTVPRQIYSSPASLPVVSPDGQTVFFIAEAGLFVARAPEFVPELVGEGLLGTGAFWVNP